MTMNVQPEASMLLTKYGCLRAAVLAIALVACAAGCTSDKASLAQASAPQSTAPGPRFDQSGPEADEFGARQGYPVGDRNNFFTVPFLVGSQSHQDQIFPSRSVRRTATPSPLARAPEPALGYDYQGRTFTLDDYMARNPATGLLVARDDTILVERYQYARTDRDRFTSWSMAKTVTSMLVGIAIAEGCIRSVDDQAATYVPALAGTEYGGTSLRHLLQMSSGVRFVEEYRPGDDVSRLAAETFRQLGSGGVASVTPYNERALAAGTKFSYASVETEVLGLVLAAAVGRPVSEYLQDKIWQPIGAEADAAWIIDRSGQEVTFCCFNAVLRDYARLGLLLAHDGNWRGRQLVPAAWVRDATTVRADQPHLRPRTATPFFGYGYQTWIFPDERRMFAFLGVRGQAIYIDPASRLVMVNTAVRKLARDPGVAETVALWRGVTRDLSR
jgi:CubicO group peptidase (beta-lactamase class C family)